MSKAKKTAASRTGKAKNKKAASNGASEIKPAPKDGPNFTLRMRSQTQIERVRRAASKTGLSMNTWAVEVLDRAAQ
jgi:predicted HicB family RNase H-like nuclease